LSARPTPVNVCRRLPSPPELEDGLCGLAAVVRTLFADDQACSGQRHKGYQQSVFDQILPALLAEEDSKEALHIGSKPIMARS